MCWPSNRSPTRSSWKLPNNQESPILPVQDGGFCMVQWENPRRERRPRRSYRRRRRFGTVFGRGAGAPHPTERRGRRSLRAKNRRDTPPGVSVSARILRVGAALAAAHPDMHVGDQGRPQGSPLRALIHRRERRRRRFGTVFGRGAGAPHPTERRGRRSLRAKS